MRPGSAFWAEPVEERSKKRWQRLYVRSNCSISAQRHLETIISDTYDESDTWSWWQTERAKEGDPIGVRAEADPRGHILKIHESKELATLDRP